MTRALAAGLMLCAGGLLTHWGAAWPEAVPDRPWVWMALVALPALLWAPGLGFALRLRKPEDGALQTGLDAAWIGLGLTWIDVAIAREAGLRGTSEAWAQWGLSLGWMIIGFVVAGPARARLMPRRERLGALAVGVAVLGLIAWRHADLARPLDGGWYLAGADEEGHEALQLKPGQGWSSSEALGEPEAGALRLVPGTSTPTLLAPEGAHGRLILAVRGPLGSRIAAGGQENTVAASMSESAEEGPVRRYLERGVAAIAVNLNLKAGEALPVEVAGDAVYVMPGTEAVWALHAVGALRYIHYYQLLNQVENQVWAEELLTSRWLTLNQPPGWSPILAVSSLWVSPDLPGANALFLWVVLLVGLSGVRLLSAVAPGAPGPAWLLPAAMAACHGLLMIEPGSCNFPDSLYAAALVGVAAALFEGRTGRFSLLAAGASVLRYPGTLASWILLGVWRLAVGPWPRGLLRRYGMALGGLAVLIAVFALAGQMEDASFIVWFETFPEHWHGNYAARDLLPRVPEFYGLWARYTGGAIVLALPGLFGGATPARRALQALLGSALLYSCILCTVDHFPSHYFLPLVALSGPILGISASTFGSRWLRIGLPIAGLLGAAAFIWKAEL